MGHRKTRRRRGLASATGAVALVALALLAPTVAQAHTGAATVSCTGADFSFTRFQPGSNTVHWIVTVDNQTVASGDYTLDENGGSSGSLHVPLSITGTHVVEANAWWGPAGVVGNETRSKYAPPLAKKNVYCETPPTPLDQASELAAGDGPHTSSSTCSVPPGSGAATSIERQPSMASRRLRSNSSMVSPWDAQPGMAGTSAQKPPSSAACTTTLTFISTLPFG